MIFRPLRILVTGWSNWPEDMSFIISDELDKLERSYFGKVDYPVANQGVIVIQGECPYGGVDKWASRWTDETFWRLSEPYPAQWRTGRWAGMARNTEMVASGADFCLGFPGPGSKGTWDCLRKAVDANIRTYIFPYNKED